MSSAARRARQRAHRDARLALERHYTSAILRGDRRRVELELPEAPVALVALHPSELELLARHVAGGRFRRRLPAELRPLVAELDVLRTARPGP